jgi:hypothetical protein
MSASIVRKGGGETSRSAYNRHTGHWFKFADAEQDLHHEKWLVKNILPSHGLNLLYGKPGCGKSFIALDIAMCVASGRDWQGHKVEQTPVLYCAVEGHSAEFGNRICAALAHYGIPRGAPDLQALMVIKRFDIFGSSEDRNQIDLHVQRVKDLYHKPPGLIIIDTLAACSPGMDEISGRDVGELLGYLNRLAERSGATILIVHHTSAAGTRERGHSSLRGECVSVLRADRDMLTVEKQREGPSGYSIGFALQTVPLEAGVTTCVVVPKSIEAEASADLKGGIGKAFAALVGLLKGGTEADLGEWRGACESVGLTEAVTPAAFRNAFKRAKDSLVALGFIEIKDEKVVRLTEKGRNAMHVTPS